MAKSVNFFNEARQAPNHPTVGTVLGPVSLFFGIIWLCASLITYSKGDKAWSTTGVNSAIHNVGGFLGAYCADALLFVLGRSGFWLVAIGIFLLFRQWMGRIKLHRQPNHSTPASNAINWPITVVGAIALVSASAALEWARLYQLDDQLPGVSGGVLGYLLGQTSQNFLGFTEMALVWIAVGVMGLSATFHFSWARVAESLGRMLADVIHRQINRQEIQEDIEIGRQAVRERESDLLTERTHTGGAKSSKQAALIEPILIVDTPIVSERVAKERQQPLFTDLSANSLPIVDLLDPPLLKQESVDKDTLDMTSRLIEKKLKDFGVEVQVIAAAPGPVITRYEIEPATGVKGSQIVALSKDLARSLSLVSIRVVETIPGKNFMALELPNARRQTIRLSEILGSNAYNDAKSLLTLSLGKDIIGNPVVADLAKMPHVLVAGTTGSGKSVGINAMILSLLYKAEAKEVRLLMIDPKMLEMSVYEGIPHLLAPVVTDMRQAGHALTWCVAEMERRYKLLSKLGVRNMAGYNAKIEAAHSAGTFVFNPFSLTPDDPEPLDRLPHIVVVIDELADLMMVVGKKVEELIARLAQKARAAGIHLILATQRPSVDVITGLIKANIPTRIAFQVSSKIDSRTILDQMGAEALLGMGDMLYMASGTGLPIRVHGAFVSDEEVHRVVEYLKSKGEPDYIDGVLEGGVADEENLDGAGEGRGDSDPMYDQAVEVVLKNRKASISLVQRHLKIGYNRAARLVEEMQNAGLVSAMGTNGQREILTPNRQE